MARTTKNRLVFLASFFVAALAIPAFYRTIDDAILRAMVSGAFFGFDGIDGTYTIHLNVYFARFLSFLSAHSDSLVWYDIAFFLLNAIAVTVLSFVCLCERDDNKTQLLIGIVLFALCLPLFARPQFTLLAGFLTIAGFACAIDSLVRGRISLRVLGLSFTLIVIGSMVRYPAFQLCSAMMTAVLSPMVFLKWGSVKNAVVPVLSVLALACVSAAGLHSVHNRSYLASTDYDDTIRLTKARHNIRNNALFFPTEETKNRVEDIRQDFGLGESDVLGLRNAYFFDRSKYDLEQMEGYSEAVLPHVSRRQNVVPSLHELALMYYYEIQNSFEIGLKTALWPDGGDRMKAIRLLELSILYVLFLVALGGRRTRLYGLFCFLMLGATFVSVSILFRPPPFRVFYALFIICFVSVMLYRTYSNEASPAAGHRTVKTASLMSIALAINLVFGLVTKSMASYAAHRDVTGFFQNLDPEKTYLIESDAFRYFYKPYDPMTQSENMKVVAGGWHSSLPWFGDLLETYGLDGTSLGFCESEDVYIVVESSRWEANQGIVRFLETSIREDASQIPRFRRLNRDGRVAVLDCEVEEL